MDKAKLKTMTVEQKTLAVYNDMKNKKFTSIEAACKAYKFAPASYYSHAKKLKKIVAMASAGIREEAELPSKPTDSQTWTSEIETLRKQNEALKMEVSQKDVKISKLERKVVNLILGEALL